MALSSSEIQMNGKLNLVADSVGALPIGLEPQTSGDITRNPKS